MVCMYTYILFYVSHFLKEGSEINRAIEWNTKIQSQYLLFWLLLCMFWSPNLGSSVRAWQCCKHFCICASILDHYRNTSQSIWYGVLHWVFPSCTALTCFLLLVVTRLAVSKFMVCCVCFIFPPFFSAAVPAEKRGVGWHHRVLAVCLFKHAEHFLLETTFVVSCSDCWAVLCGVTTFPCLSSEAVSFSDG